MNNRVTIATAFAAMAILATAASACGGSSTPATGEGAGKGGETALVKYTDTATKLTWQRPATWTKTSNSPATFSGQDEYLSVEVRPLAGSDPLAAAKADEAAVTAATTGYKLLTIAASKEVKNSAVMSYEWDLARSAVTGKPIHLRADRYYINLGNGQVAVLTESAPSTRFDREQVRDIALTVAVTK